MPLLIAGLIGAVLLILTTVALVTGIWKAGDMFQWELQKWTGSGSPPSNAGAVAAIAGLSVIPLIGIALFILLIIRR